MTHPGWIGGFPGDWTYQGDAKLLIEDTIQPIQISLRLIFVEEADIDVVLIWQGITDDDRLKAAMRMQDIKYQVIIIRTSIFLVGYSIPPFNTNNGTTKFNVVRLITYSGWPKEIDIGDNSNYFVQLRAYLNDEFSSMDEIFNTEFENTPRQRDKNSKINIDQSSLYCALNSGYKVKCGKKYIAHKDHNVFNRKNIDVLYKLSFIDILVSLNNQQINSFAACETNNLEVKLSQHLEDVLNNLCAFLSIICDYEILPVYYDYSICSQNKYISGRVIPIWERRRIPRVSRSWPTQGINFMGNITSFLECCPINKQLGRGIEHLKITVYESTVELKLMAACSAIEYFYSYWFWKIDGCTKLINESSQQNSLVHLDRNSVEKLKKLVNRGSGKTPYLSTVIRFFLSDLKIDWSKYMSDKDTPQFIQFRNELLHGSFISDDVLIFQSEEVAQKLGSEILFSIMKIISKSDDSQLCESLPVRAPQKDFYTLSDGWLEIKDLLDELHSEQNLKKFWGEA
jgi:hypothetical protein